MASSIGTTTDNLVSKLLASGYFAHVSKLEPKDPPPGDFEAAVIWQGADPAPEASGLGVVTYAYTFLIRIYRNLFAEPEEAIDPDLIVITDKVLDDLGGDFDMGASVRNVDILGEFGRGLSAQAGFITVNNTMYRTSDISVTFVVNDVVSLVA